MMDEIDFKILEELKNDSKISMKKLGERVNLTGQAANNRVLKLERDNIIEGYTISINQQAINCKIHVFINIYTHKISHNSFLDFVNAEQQFVVHNYKIIGDACYLLECRFPSDKQLNEFLEKLNQHANYNISMVINEN
ncbi:Lrp/AsnC family transcriptional regulator [Staphylococcus xylosus]|nr:Lrp/AsnC family transcriptional regulator [Staphylococcus xylosus]